MEELNQNDKKIKYICFGCQRLRNKKKEGLDSPW